MLGLSLLIFVKLYNCCHSEFVFDAAQLGQWSTRLATLQYLAHSTLVSLNTVSHMTIEFMHCKTGIAKYNNIASGSLSWVNKDIAIQTKLQYEYYTQVHKGTGCLEKTVGKMNSWRCYPVAWITILSDIGQMKTCWIHL